MSISNGHDRQRGDMSIRCKLSDFLRSRNESQTEFADRVGLARQTVQKLYNNQMSGVEFATLEKICKGLGISVGELIVLEETRLEQRLKNTSTVTIVLGAPVLQIPNLPARLVYGLGPDDVEAAFHIGEHMLHLTPSGCRIQRHWMPACGEWSTELGKRWQERENLDWQEQAQTLLKTTEGILFIIGSDFVNGFAHHCLDTILDVGYDPRGRTRQPKRMQIPYRLLYRAPNSLLPERAQGLMTRYQQDGLPEGIWDTQTKQTVVEITRRRPSQELQPGDTVTTGAIVYVDEPNFHHPHSLIIGIAGFMPKANALVAKHLFDEESLRFLDLQLRRTDAILPPVFAAAQVEYTNARLGEKLTLRR